MVERTFNEALLNVVFLARRSPQKLQLEFMNLVKIHEDNICERLRGEEPFLPSDKADRYLPRGEFYKHTKAYND